jgi:DNA 3'-phosphatase
MWKTIDTVSYYIHPKFKYNPSVSIFNLFGTIIKFKDSTDNDFLFEYLFDNIDDKLIDINEKGASIIIIQHICSSKMNQIQGLVDNLIKTLNIPIVVFLTSKFNKYSKPFTNIYKVIELLYKKEKKNINKKVSICVGNQACRVLQSTNMYNNSYYKKIDSSGKDRAFAKNIGLTFCTPEIFFNNDNTLITWKYADNIIGQTERKLLVSYKPIQPVIIDEINTLTKSNNYLIIITGTPSCGKTTLAKKIKGKWDVDYKMGVVHHISEHSYDDISKIYDDISSSLVTNSVIIDITHNYEYIQKIVELASDLKKSVLFIGIKIETSLNILFNFIQVQMSKNTKTIVNTISYLTKFKKVQYELQFNSPECKYIEFPIVLQISDEFWYDYSY